MAAHVVKMIGDQTDSLAHIASALERQLNYEKAADIRRETASVQMILLVYEKYFFRSGGYASAQIVLMQTPEGQTADVIGSGGGAGIFNMNMGSNEEFANEVVELLKKQGFSLAE